MVTLGGGVHCESPPSLRCGVLSGPLRISGGASGAKVRVRVRAPPAPGSPYLQVELSYEYFNPWVYFVSASLR